MGVILILTIYFLPTIIAIMKGKRNAGAIVFANVLFGWTIIGWGLAMIWALTKDQPATTL